MKKERKQLIECDKCHATKHPKNGGKILQH